MRTLIAIPVYNEEKHLERVLAEMVRYSPEILAVDDGSTDRSAEILDEHPFVEVHHHDTNEGYGQSLIDAFCIALHRKFDWVVTLDADEQHDPSAVGMFMAEAAKDDCDVISGSRYMPESLRLSPVPEERRSINVLITQALAGVTPYRLTDAFCGFKAYRVAALARLRLTERGYAMPLQFWVQAARADLRVREVPIKLVYVDPSRTFGGGLDDPRVRLRHYLETIDRELAAWQSGSASDGLACRVTEPKQRGSRGESPDLPRGGSGDPPRSGARSGAEGGR
jgi:glycosyltransferase involved in cell wall biosynthesis